MKKIFLTTTFMTVLIFSARSQSDCDQFEKLPPPKSRADSLTKVMDSKLNLTGSQVRQLTPVNRKYALLMETVLQSESGFFTRMDNAMKINHHKNDELEDILTHDQMKEYKKLMSKNKSKLICFLTL